MKYDIFYVSKTTINESKWQDFRKRFPSAQKIENVKTFSDIKTKAFTKFFWAVWDDIIVSKDFQFDYEVSEWDKEYIHVFKNGNFYDGITLFPKSANFTQKEFDNRFFLTGKKEIDIQASKPNLFDIVFISYNENDADDNYRRLLERFPRAKRIDGVKGIHQAHINAAKLSTTDMVWIVDADAIIDNDFYFDYQIPFYDTSARSTVHVWKSQNPINGLEYGYGGVKLLPKRLTMYLDTSSIDMTTSISSKFKVINKVSNITKFNTDPYSTWRSAFRECVKLSSKVIDRNYDDETEERLRIWCILQEDVPYGFYAHAGALAGKEYGETNIKNLEALSKINDFEWLKENFNERHGEN